MDEYKELKRMLNGVLIRCHTLAAEIGHNDDKIISERHLDNNDRLCHILNICDYDLDKNSNPAVRKILNEFFNEYQESFAILDEFCAFSNTYRQTLHG